MKKNKWALAVGGLGLTLALAACGNDTGSANESESNGEETPVVETATNTGAVSELGIPGFPLENQMDLRILGRHVGEMDWDQMPFWNVLAEDTNINFLFDTPPNQDFAQALNIALIARDYPDVFFGSALTAAMQMDLGEAGTLIPLQDLIKENAPNIQRLLDENPHIVNSITAPDGNIYALPTINQSYDGIWPLGPVYYNGLWMEELDAQVPATLDEFTELMFRFRDEMPEILDVDRVFPISATDEMRWLRAWMLSFWGMTTRDWQATDGTVVHNVTTDAYRAYLEWMNMAYSENLLHPEIFSLNGDMQAALGRDNMIGFFQAWHSNQFLGTDETQALDNPMIRPLTSEYSPDGILPRSPGFSLGQFAITNQAADPAAIMALFDWFYTPEGAIFTDLGPEGYFWEFDTHAETGETIRVRAEGVEAETSRGRFTPYFGFPAPHLIQDQAPRVLLDRDESINETFIDFLRQETAETIAAYGRVPFPPAMLTFDEGTRVSTIHADLVLEIDRLEAEFITGVRPLNDDTWAAFQADLERMGINELVEVMQAAHNRWLANAH